MNITTDYSTLDESQLEKIVGGKLIHVTPWQFYNTKTHKYSADNSAILSTTGQTMVNGWSSTLGNWVSGKYNY